MSLPVTLSYHTPCLCDTICFLLQLFSSVVKHSSEMRPSTFISSQNPALAPWVVHACLSPGSERLQLHHWDLASALPSLSLSPPASFLGRRCPSSKPLPVKPVSTHQIKSQCWLTCAKQGCYLRKGMKWEWAANPPLNLLTCVWME